MGHNKEYENGPLRWFDRWLVQRIKLLAFSELSRRILPTTRFMRTFYHVYSLIVISWYVLIPISTVFTIPIVKLSRPSSTIAKAVTSLFGSAIPNNTKQNDPVAPLAIKTVATNPVISIIAKGKSRSWRKHFDLNFLHANIIINGRLLLRLWGHEVVID